MKNWKQGSKSSLGLISQGGKGEGTLLQGWQHKRCSALVGRGAESGEKTWRDGDATRGGEG